MITPLRMAQLAQLFQRSFPRRTIVNVLPTPANHLALAAGMAGMDVKVLVAAEWPFPELISRFPRHGAMKPLLVGQAETAQHNMIRDRLADQLNAAPGGAAIIEVAMSATLSQVRADADIVCRAPKLRGSAKQVFFEVKTGRFSEIRPNQRYIYALALLGGHVTSNNQRLPKVGLRPGVPMPAMDFMLVTADPPDYLPAFALLRASQVDRAATLAMIMGEIAMLENAP